MEQRIEILAPLRSLIAQGIIEWLE